MSFIHLLSYVSSCCNPITYCFMNSTFRQGFLAAFRCCYRRRRAARFSSRRTDLTYVASLRSGNGTLELRQYRVFLFLLLCLFLLLFLFFRFFFFLFSLSLSLSLSLTLVLPLFLLLLLHLLLIHIFRRLFPYVDSSHCVFIIEVLRFCASSLCTHLSFKYFFYNIIPPTSVLVFLSLGVHSLPSSYFSLLHLPLSFSPPVPLISVSHLYFSHLCLPYLPLFIFLLFDLPNPIIPIIHLKMSISVLPSKSCSGLTSNIISDI